MKTVLLTASLLGITLTTTARADHQNGNLRAFESVCPTLAFEAMEREDEAQFDRLGQEMLALLQEAKIPVAKSGCRENGITRNRQLNLVFDFSSTKSGGAYLGTLEGWLHKEGLYSAPTVWSDTYYGATPERPTARHSTASPWTSCTA
ncbi:hypothetical protein ACFSC4_22320 [Deinococcus malanensis]|uniref:hypothetical protein n=1 Tax=Deinococcus malanensis TaxID=1706855 RepID=UPI00363A7A90